MEINIFVILFILVCTVGLLAIVLYANLKIHPSIFDNEVVEIIDCDNCANIKCPIRESGSVIESNLKDPRCEYIPIENMYQ